MYKNQASDSTFITTTPLTQLNVRMNIVLTCEKKLESNKLMNRGDIDP